MGYRSTIQIVLIIISLVIIFTYIRPTFTEMKETQIETEEYKVALRSAEAFKQELASLLSEVDRFSTSELRLLERYIPDEIDTIATMRDIETILNNNNMGLNSLTSESTEEQDPVMMNPAQGQEFSNGNKSFELYVQTFELSASGTYEQFKMLLQDFEKNAYPLEISSIDFEPGEGTLYTFDITLETYSFSSNVLAE